MTVKIVKNTVTSKLNQLIEDLDALPAAVYREWVKTTPKRTGNARRQTRLKGETIEADYPYAQRLDAGASKQAPQGMTQPITKFIEQQVNKITRK